MLGVCRAHNSFGIIEGTWIHFIQVWMETTASDQ